MKTVLKYFLVYAASTVAAGWLLSLFRMLSPGWYVPVFIGIFTVLCWILSEKDVRTPSFISCLGKEGRRLRRFPVTAFAVLALFILLGGLCYYPANFDALSYRGSRVLHWIAEGGWHWIHSETQRVNTRGTVFEWMSVPFYLLLKSDRPLFLLNATAFLLLPGLCFRLFRGCGLSGRTSWWWMWLVPMGYGYVLQAGSIGNDAVGAVFFIASLVLLFPDRAGKVKASDLFLSLLAIGLATGVKATNLVLGLPWLYVFCCQWRTALRHKALILGAALLGLCISFVPTALLNHLHSGDWTGMSAESDEIAMKNPLAGLLGNSFLLVVQNVQPFVLPMAAKLTHVMYEVLPESMKSQFPNGAFGFSELQMEEGAGLGMGISAVLVWALFAGFGRPRLSVRGWIVSGFGFVAILVFMATSALTTPSRMLLSCYPLLMVPFLACISPLFLKGRLWKTVVWLIPLSALAVVVLTPPRPLFPVSFLTNTLQRMEVGGVLVERVKKVYRVYGGRGRAFDPLLARIPGDVKLLGFYSSGDAPETALWRPFGGRRILPILDTDSQKDLEQKSIRLAVVSDFALRLHGVTLEQWLAGHGGTVQDSVTLELKASQEPEIWYIVHWP